jgi:hypothetical protein
MAQQNINTGTPNGQDGDFVRDAFVKAEANFTELYNRNERRIIVTSEWTGDLNFRCTAKSFPIQGEWYNILLPNATTLSLDPADALLDRVDLIVANSSSLTIYAIKGDLSENPVEPVPAWNEYPINFVLVRAGETSPDGFEDVTVWNENVGSPNEWDFTADIPTRGPGQTIVAGQANTFDGLWSLNASQTVDAKAKFVSATRIPTPRLNTLTFYLKLKEDYTVKGKIYITFDQTSNSVGTPTIGEKPDNNLRALPPAPVPSTKTEIVIGRAQNGFEPSNTGWQKITLDLSRTNFVTSNIDQLSISVNKGSVSGNADGYYLDLVNLQLLSESTSEPTEPTGDVNRIEYTSQLINNGEGDFDPSGDMLKFITKADLSNPEPGGNNILNATVTFLQDLDFRVDPISYPIEGVWYEGEPNQLISLTAAHPTLSRIDVIGVDRFGDATKVTGTAAAVPRSPNVDETVMYPIQEVVVDPAQIDLGDTFSEVQLFNEGTNGTPGTEWDSEIPNTGSTISTVGAQLGSYGWRHVAKGGAANGFLDLTPGSLANLDGTKLEAISFYLKLNNPALSRITLQLYEGVATRAKIYILNGSYGLDHKRTDWQKITVPLNTVNIRTDVDRVTLNVMSSSQGLQTIVDNVVAYLEDSDIKDGGGALVTESFVTNSISGKADITYVDTSVSTKADTATVNTALSSKADTTYVDTGLAAKADDAATTTALNLKATELYVDSAVATKADTTTVNTALALKVDTTTLTTELADKADSSTVNSQLALKADTSALAAKADTTTVNTALALKADATALAAKADTATVNTALAAKVDTTTLTTELAAKADVAPAGTTLYTTETRVLTAGELNSIGTSPIVLVAPGAAETVIPVSLAYKFDVLGNNYSSNNVEIKIDQGSANEFGIVPGAVIAGAALSTYRNVPIELDADLGEGDDVIITGTNSSTIGGGTLKIIFTYQIV